MFILVLALVGAIAAIVAGWFALLVGMMTAARKGYQSGVLVVGIVLGIGLGAALFFTLVSMSDSSLLLPLAPLFFLLPPAAALRFLPKRKPRRIFSVHRVTFPYALVGKTILALGCVASLVLAPIAWWSDASIWQVLLILVAGPVATFPLMVLITYVMGQPDRAVQSFTDILTSDPRPPVVLMRAFERESDSFVSGPITKYQKYSAMPRLHTRQTVAFITLDTYLRAPLTARIGPFLALGNPQDYYTPSGAVRAYFKDETWMQEFRELAARAACLLVQAGASANLRWELQHLRSSNLHHRLIVVTEHPSRPYRSRFVRRAAELAGVEWPSWARFAAALTELGYEMPGEEPPLGSVIGFDADARAHVLVSGADLPDEFVEPMEKWLADNRVSTIDHAS